MGYLSAEFGLGGFLVEMGFELEIRDLGLEGGEFDGEIGGGGLLLGYLGVEGADEGFLAGWAQGGGAEGKDLCAFFG